MRAEVGTSVLPRIRRPPLHSRAQICGPAVSHLLMLLACKPTTVHNTKSVLDVDGVPEHKATAAETSPATAPSTSIRRRPASPAGPFAPAAGCKCTTFQAPQTSGVRQPPRWRMSQEPPQRGAMGCRESGCWGPPLPLRGATKCEMMSINQKLASSRHLRALCGPDRPSKQGRTPPPPTCLANDGPLLLLDGTAHATQRRTNAGHVGAHKGPLLLGNGPLLRELLKHFRRGCVASVFCGERHTDRRTSFLPNECDEKACGALTRLVHSCTTPTPLPLQLPTCFSQPPGLFCSKLV